MDLLPSSSRDVKLSWVINNCFYLIEYTKDEYKENQIEKEAVVYTSGLGGIFKPGIPVGKITNNSEQLTFFSDFGQLSFVKIVKFKIGEDQ